MKKVIRLENLDCANCAAKLERAIAKIDGVEEVSVNFMAQRIDLELSEGRAEDAVLKVKRVAGRIEPDCILKGV